MFLVVRSVAALLAVALLSAGAAVYGQEAGTVQPVGRRLDEALAELRGAG